MFSCLLCLALVCGVAAVDDEHLTECRTPKGMHSGHITDNNLKVSSSAANRTKEKARYGCCEDECNAAWCPDSNDKSPYYEVHFDKPTTVAAISFMHPTSANQACHFYATAYMKKFRLLFTPVIGTEEFVEFNHDIDAIYNKSLSYTVGFIPTFVTQTIRIEPEESHIAPCFKFEVFGCEPSALCPKDFCDHEGTCIGTNQCQCKDRFFGDKCQYTDQQILQKTYSFLFTKIVQNILFTTSFNMTTTGHVEIETVGTQNLIVLREGGAAQVDIESGHVDSCLKDLDTCASGFTYSLTLNIEKMTSQKIYLLSNDAFEDNNRGLWLVYEGSKLSCHVATSERIWNLDVTTAIALSTWYKIEVSWNKNLGLQLLLNDKVIGTKVQSFEKTHVATKTKALSIGSALNTGVVIRVFELKLVPLVRSEVSRANITTETLPPALMPIPTETECKTPLGMENRSILSKQLTVSSSADGHNKDDARYGPPEGTAGKAWCPKETTGSFFEVTFNKPTAIGGLHFQHPQMAKNSFPTDYMKTFRLLFKNSYSNESRLTEFSQNIPALYNATTAFTISFTPIIVTDVIRFEPETWESAPCFRFELFGCDPSFLCKSDFCENGGSCIGENLCICTAGFYGYDCSVTHVTVTTYTFLHIISNMVITATQNFSIHGDVTIDTKTSLLTLSSTAFIEMAKPGHCLTNLDTCFSGFTFSLTVNFLQLTTNKFYLMTSGGDQDGVKGIALYYQAKQLYCYVTTSSKRWLLVVPYVLETTHWYRFHISWNPNLGLQLFENKTLIGSVFTVAGVYIHASKVQSLYIGNQITIQNSLVMVIQKFETANQVFKEIEKSRVKEASLPPTLPPFNSMSTVPATGPIYTEAPTESRPAATTSTTGTTAATTAVCETLLGMSSGAITDDQLSVSSSSPDHDQQKLRLDCCENEQLGSWCAAENDTKPWVEINLKTAQAISQILFQHPAEMTVPASAFVRFVNIYYNNLLSNNSQLELYSRHVRAMYNDTLAYHVKLEPAVVTDTLRLVITDYVNQPCMRLELVGCESQVLCGPGFCKNGGVCAGEHVCLCSTEFYGHMCQFKRPDIPQFKYEIIDKVNNIVTTTHGNLTVHEIVSVKPIRSHHVLVLGKQGYVEVPLTHSCIQDLDNCRTGFTYSINTNFQTIGTEMPILATGKGDSGVLLIYRDGKMLCTVGTSKAMWIVSAVIVLEVKTWYQIDLSWSMFHGLHLYIDGVKIAGTVASGVNHHGFTKHPLCIGYGYTPITGLEHFEFWVRQLQIFYTYRHDLIKADILEKYQHPQTTSIPTTTIKPSVCNSTMTDITFTTINGTDLLTSLNTMKVHGAASLEQAKEGTLLVLDGPGQYVDLQETGIPCLDDITTCNTSFNFRLTFQFITIDVNSNYIISSGGNIVDSSGIALYYWNGQLNFWVKNSLTIGKSRYYVNITAGVWYTLDATWDKETGNTSMYLNGKTLQNRPLPNIPAPSSTKTHTLLIGKSPDKDHTSHIKLLLFRLWTESHTELIQNNCTKAIEMPVLPTPTSAPVETCNGTPIHSGKTMIDLSFQSIENDLLETTDLTIRANGNPVITKQNDSSSLDLSQPGQYIEIDTECLPCLSDLPQCSSGFTIQLVVTFSEIDIKSRKYIICTDQYQPGQSGVCLFYEMGRLKGNVATGTQKWPINFSYEIEFHVPYTFQISWSRLTGYQLYINEYTMPPTQALPLLQNATKTSMSFWVGKSPKSNATTPMVVANFKIYLATREVLVQRGILQPVLTTPPTTTLTPPTPPSLPEFEWHFENITSTFIMSSYLNLTIHGHPKGDKSGIHFSHSNQYLEIANIPKTCLTDLTYCRNGLTIVLEMIFNHIEENTVILTTGAEKPDLPGISVVYRYGHFHFICSSTTEAWFVSVPREHIQIGVSHVLYISWKHTLKIYVDKVLITAAKEHITHPRPSHELKDVFYFGKSFTSSSTVRPLQCVIKTLHIWYKYIDELEKAGELLIDERTTYMPIATSTSIPGTCPMGCVPILETSTKLEPTTLPTTEVAEIKTQPPTPTPTTTPAMTTIDPGVPTFSVTLTLTPVVDMTGTYLTCTLSLYQTKNVEIQFQWYIDEIEQVTKTVTTPLLQGRLYVSEIKGVKDTLYDKEIFCTAKAKYTIGREWTSVIQSATFRPAITPLTSTRATITMTEGQHPSHIEVKTNCPPQMFCKLTDKGKCNVDVIATVVNNHHESKCTRDIILPQIVVQKDGTASAVCGKSMTSSNWHESIKIPIKATIDGLHDDDQHRDVHIKLKTTGLVVKESLMKTIAAYKVTAKDTDGHRYSTCASLNDPHITTFDGNHYNNYQHGEYVLYKHKTLPYEVRTRYQTCSSRNPRGPTCNCAVAIKSGDDVITLTGCHGTTGHPSIFNRFFHRSRTPPITVEMYKNGDLTPGTTVRRVGCGQQYEIRLPTGTLITVKSSYLSFINVWVRASAVDYQQTLGLCGSFNRNKRDDLYGSDHKTYPISRQPDHFSQTWHISEIQTMFHGVSTVTTSTDTFCSCMDGARPICQPNLDIFRCSTATLRDDITATLVRQAKTPTPTLRRTKRAAPIEDKPFMEDDPQTKYTNSSARQACKDFIDNKSATKTCASYVNVTDELLQECADDLVATGDKEWAQSHLDHIVIECIGEAVRNVGMYRGDNSTIFDRIPDDIMTALCPEQCQHGKCREGSCVCYDGYTGPTCNVDKNSKPEILPVTEDGLGCNADGDDSCSEISIMGFDFVESDSLTCFYQLIDVAAHVSGNGQWIPTPATYLSTYQVVCSLPHPQSARVAVSNDGQTLSERSYLHVVYDDCHTCEINDDGTDASCSRKADTCLIGESCYKNGDKMSGSECAVCDPTANMGNWTLNTDPLCSATKLTSSPQSQDEEVAASTIALGVIVAVLAVVIVAGVVIYCKKRPANMKRKLVEEGEYNFTSPQSRLSSMPRPNMRDISFSNTVYDGTAESLKAPEMTETH